MCTSVYFSSRLSDIGYTLSLIAPSKTNTIPGSILSSPKTNSCEKTLDVVIIIK